MLQRILLAKMAIGQYGFHITLAASTAGSVKHLHGACFSVCLPRVFQIRNSRSSASSVCFGPFVREPIHLFFSKLQVTIMILITTDLQYGTRCYFNVCSKADTSQLLIYGGNCSGYLTFTCISAASRRRGCAVEAS